MAEITDKESRRPRGIERDALPASVAIPPATAAAPGGPERIADEAADEAEIEAGFAQVRATAEAIRPSLELNLGAPAIVDAMIAAGSFSNAAPADVESFLRSQADQIASLAI